MAKPGDFLWGRLRRLEYVEKDLTYRVERLMDALAWYACDCEDWKRHGCKRKPCGIHAAELLDELKTRETKP